MRKLLVTVSIVLAISYQIQNSHAFIIDAIGTASSVIGLGQFLVDVANKFQPTETNTDDAFNEIITMNNQVLDQTKTIVRIVENLPKVIRYEVKKEKIDDCFASIKSIFQDTLEVKSNIERGHIHNNSGYQTFAIKGNELDNHFNVITTMFTDQSTYALGQGFIGNLKTFEGTCETRMSNFQLLDSLLVNMRFATAQYYWAKKFMWDFLEISTGQNFTGNKHDFLDSVGKKYAKVAVKLQTMMANASSEVWKCDPIDGFDDSIRSINNTDSNFAEMRAFSKYIFSQHYALESYLNDRCERNPCDGFKKMDRCYYTDYNHLCPKTQLCPGKLLCDPYGLTTKGNFKVCVNKNKQSPYRYHTIAPSGDTFPFRCSGNDKEIMEIGPELRSSGDGRTTDRCHHCNCICEQGYGKNGKYHGFFVDNRRVKAGTRKQANKIVVGARLVLEPFNTGNFSGQILRIQIREATLLANGAIAGEEWKKSRPIQEKHLIKIQWDKNRRFYLSPVMVNEDEVITGLAFNRRSEYGPAANDFALRVIAQKVDFVTGVLDTSEKHYRNAKTLTKPFDLFNVDVPTRAISKNNLHSSADQYVDLSLTSDELDGGQSTVPFIDTQQWSVGTPLAGASLYVRSQPKFGGFLSLKFWTFNTTKFIITDQKFVNMTVAQRSNLTRNFHNISRIQKNP